VTYVTDKVRCAGGYMSGSHEGNSQEPAPTVEMIFPEEGPPLLPTFSEDGIDLTAIRWMLSLSPLERLRTAQNYANSARRLQNARRKV
jgi:hypothetical protein